MYCESATQQITKIKWPEFHMRGKYVFIPLLYPCISMKLQAFINLKFQNFIKKQKKANPSVSIEIVG